MKKLNIISKQQKEDNFKKYWTHPEMKKDEVFIGNGDDGTFNDITWKTKRRGKKAYNYIQNKFNEVLPKLFPIFISKQEMEDYRNSKFVKEDKTEYYKKIKLRVKEKWSK